MVSQESFSAPFEKTSGSLDADFERVPIVRSIGGQSLRSIREGYADLGLAPSGVEEDSESHAERLRGILDD